MTARAVPAIRFRIFVVSGLMFICYSMRVVLKQKDKQANVNTMEVANAIKQNVIIKNPSQKDYNVIVIQNMS